LFLLDIVIAVVIFVGVGRYYMSHRGAVVLGEKEKARVAAEVEAKRLVAEADSVMRFEAQRLQEMKADSVRNVEALNRRREELQMHLSERDRLVQNVFRSPTLSRVFKPNPRSPPKEAAEYQSTWRKGPRRPKRRSSSSRSESRRSRGGKQPRPPSVSSMKRLHEDLRTGQPLPGEVRVVVDQELANGDR
jgi:hypothetical protein